jgi:hypothetical protein
MSLRHYIANTVAVFALATLVVFGWAHQSLENVRKQRRLIAEFERVPCRIKFHDDRYVAPVWLQTRYFDKPLRCLQRIEFDFEDHPDVTELHIRSLACFSQLEGIHSQVTGLTGEGLAALRGLRHLKELDVCACPLSPAGFQNISRLRHLTWLSICDTKATDVEMSLVANLRKLEWLSVSGKELTDQGVATLSVLGNLRHLSFHWQPITDESLRHIGRLTRLESLDLMKTKINGSGFHHLSRLRNLTNLRLGGLGASVNDEDVEALNKSLWL